MWTSGNNACSRPPNSGLPTGPILSKRNVTKVWDSRDSSKHTRSLGTPGSWCQSSGHYSWSKAMKLLGLGTAQMDSLEVDSSMRMSIEHLGSRLQDAETAGDLVIAVVPILGTTEFGAIDPIDRVVALRRENRAHGREFGIHVDAAWGGYLRSLFISPAGDFRSHSDVRSEFTYFPTPAVYAAFEALCETDSATVDPHKLGFIPYPAGAYVARDRNIVNFVQQDAAYVFEPTSDDDARFRMLGQYILEGSKPGATVVSAYLTHRCVPLHQDGFGKIIANSIRSCEMFFDLAHAWAERHAGRVILAVPFEPDANIACFALNPTGNTDVRKANAFTRKVLEHLTTTRNQPVQGRDFMVSSTKLFRRQHGTNADHALTSLGLDLQTFGEPDTDHLLVLRHTLMNPWLAAKTSDGKNYLELYFDHLDAIVEAVLSI
ncbi:MAG: pyridoxal-dependent decarboxylase [bacterium]